jgi:hypothetical protein
MSRKQSNTQYLLKVNLKGAKRIWRLIALRGDQTLNDLHETIYSAFDRYDEHLYSFYFPKALTGRERHTFRSKEYTSPIALQEPNPLSDERPFNAARTRLDDLHLHVGQTFEYLFDFGDMWWHELKIVAIEPVETNENLPKVLESHGDSPQQYPSNE